MPLSAGFIHNLLNLSISRQERRRWSTNVLSRFSWIRTGSAVNGELRRRSAVENCRSNSSPCDDEDLRTASAVEKRRDATSSCVNEELRSASANEKRRNDTGSCDDEELRTATAVEKRRDTTSSCANEELRATFAIEKRRNDTSSCVNEELRIASAGEKHRTSTNTESFDHGSTGVECQWRERWTRIAIATIELCFGFSSFEPWSNTAEKCAGTERQRACRWMCPFQHPAAFLSRQR